jgi:4'-phosphopantetheinyl transferase
VRFNLSHSGDRALLAVALDVDVGVDIEAMRPEVEFRAIAERMFSAAERAAFARLADGELAPAFYRVWTRKEAFIKLLGDGLSFPLEDFDVSLDEDGGLDACRGHDRARFRVSSLPAAPGHAAALATGPPAERISRWGWEIRSGGDGATGRWIP